AELERYLIDRNATFVACADLQQLPAEPRMGLPLGVCIGVRLETSIIAGITEGPTPEYAAEYVRVNELLQRLGEHCATFLQGRGFRAVSFAPPIDLKDRESLETPLPHKTVATLAGTGWVGKCALLVTESYGSAVRFNTVFTDTPLPADEPVEVSRCGECDFCVTACPAGAVSGCQWHQGLERALFFDAAACRDCASRLGAKAGSDRTICGICIAVCPYTQRYLNGNKGKS
ncbi:MAG: epoxyqueuosine reductase, partial [Deltaproteobacteria bacterium]